MLEAPLHTPSWAFFIITDRADRVLPWRKPGYSLLEAKIGYRRVDATRSLEDMADAVTRLEGLGKAAWRDGCAASLRLDAVRQSAALQGYPAASRYHGRAI